MPLTAWQVRQTAKVLQVLHATLHKAHLLLSDKGNYPSLQPGPHVFIPICK